MKTFFLLTAGIQSSIASAFAEHLASFGLTEAKMTDSDFAIALVGRGCGRIVSAFLEHAGHYQRPILFVGVDAPTAAGLERHLPEGFRFPAIHLGPEGEACRALAVLAADRQGLNQEQLHALGAVLSAA